MKKDPPYIALPFLQKLIASCVVVFSLAVAAQADPLPGSLWYNGDLIPGNDEGVLRARPNYVNPSGYDITYDDFIVPASDGSWTVTSVYSNLFSLPGSFTGAANWSIRTGLSVGNGGTIIAGGTLSPATITPGGSGFSLRITGLNTVLAPGLYWLNVSPVLSGPTSSLILATQGKNAVGLPPGNDGNAFVDANNIIPHFGAYPADFSMGVIGTRGTTSVPDSGSTALLLFLPILMIALCHKQRGFKAA